MFEFPGGFGVKDLVLSVLWLTFDPLQPKKNYTHTHTHIYTYTHTHIYMDTQILSAYCCLPQGFVLKG